MLITRNFVCEGGGGGGGGWELLEEEGGVLWCLGGREIATEIIIVMNPLQWQFAFTNTTVDRVSSYLLHWTLKPATSMATYLRRNCVAKFLWCMVLLLFLLVKVLNFTAAGKEEEVFAKPRSVKQ